LRTNKPKQILKTETDLKAERENLKKKLSGLLIVMDKLKKPLRIYKQTDN